MSTTMHSAQPHVSLRINFSWAFVGNVTYAVCQWGMLVVLAKLASPEMLGQFALGLALTAPVIEFAYLQLDVLLATDARRKYLFGHYLALRLAMTMLALLVIASIALGGTFSRGTALVILMVGAAKAIEAISLLVYGLLQQREWVERIARSLMARGALSLFALAGGLYLTDDIVVATAGMALAWGLVLAVYDLRSIRLALDRLPAGDVATGERADETMRPLWAWQTLVSLGWLALPLGVVTFTMSLNASIPRYFVGGYLGEYELGIFAALAYFHRAGNTVVTALAQSTTPRLSQHFARSDWGAFGSLLLKVLGIALVLGVGGMAVALVAGREILSIAYDPEYARQHLFVLLMLASALAHLVSVLEYSMTAIRYVRVQIVLSAVSTGVLAVACLLVIPGGGLEGAALAMIIAKVVQLLGALSIVGYALYTQPHPPLGALNDPTAASDHARR